MKRKSIRRRTDLALRVLVVMAMTLSFGSSSLLAQEGDAAEKEKPKKKPGVEMLECKVLSLIHI